MHRTGRVQLMGSLRRMRFVSVLLAFLMLVGTSTAYAAIPGGKPAPRGAMPNPGTQQQELANITFPAPYNTFEFVVTCMACHGGTVDQNASHGGNWAGTNMASAARDPFFRANELIVNAAVKAETGQDGAGNLCFRCHSPNGWYSGRFDPALAGDSEGRTMMHSILASTDDEGILCEACHRAMGNVTMGEVAGNPAPDEPAFKLMSSVYDTRMAGGADGGAYPLGPATGSPLGDATLQINDGMTYGGPYAGSVEVTFSDLPIEGTPYTGQTYGVYPQWWIDMGIPKVGIRPAGEPLTNSAGQHIVYNPDGSVPLHFEVPADVPRAEDNVTPDFMAQSLSLEHPTFKSDFITSSEFCGSCHDLTVPLGSGMPEQRTYSEWAFSDYGDETSGDFERCQDCHMPKMLHEYSDDNTATLNPDPVLAGFFPYGKDRSGDGGTAFHKLAGANRDLPEAMKLLYPEVDLEIIGAPTGRDTRIFPGMMSDRTTTWERASRNAENMVRNSLSVGIESAPVEVSPGTYEVQLRVTNNTGHKVPSGYPDGRRAFVTMRVNNGETTVYESGVYDQETADLTAGSGTDTFSRATSNLIDATDGTNELMVYEKVTGAVGSTPGEYVESPALLNDTIIFDNRIPPKGWDAVKYEESGMHFRTYSEGGGGVVPVDDPDRFGPGENWDLITYRFNAPTGLAGDLSVEADVQMQTHSRQFVEFLKDHQPVDSPRPEGPPSKYSANYPLEPTYLSDNIGLEGMTDLAGEPLPDNWGGIAYASWLLTGKGAPQLMDTARTAETILPAPTNVVAAANDPFSIAVQWEGVEGADGYDLYVRYGQYDASASWDKLATLEATPSPSFLHDGLNVGKTFGYRVVAWNGAGDSPASAAVNAATPTDLPLAPMQLRVVTSTANSISLSWFDMADNENTFIIQRQDVPPTADYVTVAQIQSQTPGGATGGNVWVDTNVTPGTAYNYRIAAANDIGQSIWSLPVMGATLMLPGTPAGFTAAATSPTTTHLSWIKPTGTVSGYRIERATALNGPYTVAATLAGTATTFDDSGLLGNTKYYYKIYAFNAAGDGQAAATTVTTPLEPPIRISGTDRYETAAAAANAAFPGWTGVTHVVIASGETASQPDALAAAGLAGAYNGPLLFVQQNALPTATRNALLAMPDGVQVHVIGGTAAVTNSVLTAMDALAGVGPVERVPAGTDRYATAANVATRMKGLLGDAFPKTALIVNGANASFYFDGLTASPVSASQKFPILLVQTGSVPAATTNAIGSLGITRSYIVGGTTAVSAAVANTLNVAAADRISGATRYATAVSMANRAKAEGWLGFMNIGVASSITDALSGGASIGHVGGPMLFTAPTALSPETSAFLSTNKAAIKRVYVYGGTAAISDSVVTQIGNVLQ